MKDFPYVEEIYDMETDELKRLLDMINSDIEAGNQCEVPERFDSSDKYLRKASKMKEHIELELEERGQVDNVLNFFLASDTTADETSLLDDEQFYKPMDLPKSNES